jgi:hypothetical protein
MQEVQILGPLISLKEEKSIHSSSMENWRNYVEKHCKYW